MEVSDPDNEVCWNSPILTVTGSVSISVTITATGDLEPDDYVDVKYISNGGAPVTITNWNSKGTGTHTLVGDCSGCPAASDWGTETVNPTGISAVSTFQLLICIDGNGGSERIIVDDISVTGALLPIEVTAFEGKLVENKKVMLNWTTFSESNNNYIGVERSRNGIQFEEIGRIQGSGSSNSVREYFFIDENPFLGINYYRLRQVDFNGAEQVHQVISVRKDGVDKIRFSPVPVSRTAVIEFPTNLENGGLVQVFSITGGLVFSQPISRNSAKIEIDLQSLPAGTYIAKVRSEELSFESLKFSKL